MANNKIAFLFPGQASQYVGMGQELYETNDIAKKYYDEANEILGFDLAKVSFEGPIEELKQTRITQPAIFVLSVIMSEILKSKGLTPDFTAGHSLGEYSALVSAGAISFQDALKVVKLRGEEMQKAGEENPGTMAAIVGLVAEDVIKACKEGETAGIVQSANFNSPKQTVISGSIDGVQKGMRVSKDMGAKIVKELVVSGAFHSPLMKSAVEPLRKVLNTIEIKTPEVEIVANVTAKGTKDPKEIKKLLVEQVTAPVKWADTIEYFVENGVTKFYEVGPGKVLQGLVRQITRDIKCIGVGAIEDLKGL